MKNIQAISNKNSKRIQNRSRILFSSFLGILSILLLSGCTPNYNFEPNYNSSTKELVIDGLKFSDVDEDYNQLINQTTNGNFIRKNKRYSVANNKCLNMTYTSVKAGTKSYIIDNNEIKIKEKVKQGLYSCNMTYISNLVFAKCETRYKTMEYYILSSTTSFESGGYSESSKLIVDSKCFNTLKNHYMDKGLSEGLEINEYTLKNKSFKYPKEIDYSNEGRREDLERLVKKLGKVQKATNKDLKYIVIKTLNKVPVSFKNDIPIELYDILKGVENKLKNTNDTEKIRFKSLSALTKTILVIEKYQTSNLTYTEIVDILIEIMDEEFND